MPVLRRDFLKCAVASAVAPALSRWEYWEGPQPQGSPAVDFPAAARDRIAVASYPFRDFILGRRDLQAVASKMPLKEFAGHVRAKFDVRRIEPWSAHFLSLEGAYLDEIGDSLGKAGCSVANIAADGENSFYSEDPSVRERAVAFGKTWVDVAARLKAPSVRVNLPGARGAKPDLSRVAEGLKTVTEYAASRNVVVHLENDNPVSEDPFFIAGVLDRVASSWLRALPDFGNSLAALPPEEAYRGLEQMFARAYAISHAKDTATTAAGAAVSVDMPRVFALAKKHGYRGCFSMEWDSEGDPYSGTERLVATTLKNLS
jgi:sugar phosphate isomerase/epimerase